MAEYVQQNLEEMLPELEQIERIGICSSEETRKILKKRKAFEYKLQRRIKSKEDFLRYIKYEMSVLQLIKTRRQKIGYKKKTKEIDIAIVQRIYKLFKLATNRFQDDVKLWMSYIEFAQSRKENSIASKTFTKMLQIHNKKADLWIAAAKWEWTTNNSPDNARHLLQQGLRYLKDNQQLWQEYFRMELMYAEKLRLRRTALGIEAMPEMEEISDAVLDGRIAEIVYNKAVENVQDNVDFILSLLHICRLFEFAKPIKENILSSLKKDYSDRPQTWNALARDHLHNSVHTDEDEERFHRVYEETLKETVVPKDQLWQIYLTTCLEYIEKHSPSQTLQEKRISNVLSLFETAEQEGFVNKDLYSKWVKVLVNVGLLEKALDTIKRAVSKHSKNVLLWQQYLQLSIKTKLDEEEALQIFKESQNSVPQKKSLELWKTILDFCIACQSSRTEELFEKGICTVRKVAAPLKELYLQWMYLNSGIVKTRKLFKRLTQIKLVSLQLFYEYFKIENAQPTTRIEILRQAYEDALLEYGNSSAELWLDFIKLEMTHQKGDPENIGKIHYRALKQLDGELSQQFVTEFTLLQTGHEIERMED